MPRAYSDQNDSESSCSFVPDLTCHPLSFPISPRAYIARFYWYIYECRGKSVTQDYTG
jgi:hypothetical protein